MILTDIGYYAGGNDWSHWKWLTIKPFLLLACFAGRTLSDNLIKYRPAETEPEIIERQPQTTPMAPARLNSYEQRNIEQWATREGISNKLISSQLQNTTMIINPQLESHHPRPVKTRFDQPLINGWPSPNDIYLALENNYESPAFCLQVGAEFIWNGPGHCITFGSTRSGKGVRILLPLLLHNDNYRYDHAPSFVVLDPKGENAAISHDYLKSAGYNVHVINPFGIPEIARLGSKRFNPFDLYPADDPDFYSFLDMFCYSLIPPSNHQNSHWDSSARMYLSLYIRHMMTQNREPKNVSTLYKWLRYSGTKRDDFFAELMHNKAFGGNIRVDALNIFAEMKEGGQNHINGIYSTLTPFLDMFKDERLIDAMSMSDFDLRQLAKRKTAIFICANRTDIETHKVWFRILINSVMRNLTKHYNPDRRVVVIMDEFASCGHLHEFEMMVSDTAGYNVTLWPVMQSITQLKTNYPNSWELFMSSSIIQHYIKCSGETAEYLAKKMPQVNTAQWDGKPSYGPIVNLKQIEKDFYMDVRGLYSPFPMVDTSYYLWDETKDNASPNPFRQNPLTV